MTKFYLFGLLALAACGVAWPNAAAAWNPPSGCTLGTDGADTADPPYPDLYAVYSSQSGAPILQPWPGGLDFFEAANGVFATLPGLNNVRDENLLYSNFVGLLVAVSYTPFLSSYEFHPVATLSQNSQPVQLPDAGAIFENQTLFSAVTITLPVSLVQNTFTEVPDMVVAPEYEGSDPFTVPGIYNPYTGKYQYEIDCFETRLGSFPVEFVGNGPNGFVELPATLPAIQELAPAFGGVSAIGLATLQTLQ